MSRRLSTYAVQSALARQASDAWLFLIDITHPSDQDIHIVNNTDQIVSNGVTYEPFPFALSLSIDDAESVPYIKLVVDNVSRKLVKMVRATGASPKFVVKLVLSGKPDDVEFTVDNLTMLECSFDAYQMQTTLYIDDFLNVRYPADLISPASGYDGLFRQ